MSAIFGLLHRDGKPVDPEHLQRMSLVLEPHGPDDHGCTIQGHVGLGYRLRRFTPEDSYEAQPLCDAGTAWFVSEARLDNRKELADEWGIPSSEVARMPDSAFILQAWRRWGSDCAARLRGAFSFAVYDARNRTLLLARSPRGARALLYFNVGSVFAFSTAPKGLFALPFVDRKINLSRLADFLLVKPSDLSATFYAGIESVPAGHTLQVRSGSTELRRFWSLDRLPGIRFRRDEDYVEAFNSLFDRVVQDSLRSVSPVGIMLSGGLDSTAVAASAALTLYRAGKRLTAFTEVAEDTATLTVPPGRYSDETPFVEATGRRYPNIDLNYVRTPGAFFLQGLDRFFEAAEVPFRNASNRAWMEAIQQQAAGRGVRVVLTGVGGNLTISWGGYGLVPDLIRRCRLLRALAETRGLARTGLSSSPLRALMSGVLFLLPDPLWIAVNRLKNPHDSLYSDKASQTDYSPIGPGLFSDLGSGGKTGRQGGNLQFRLRADSRARTLEHAVLGVEIRRGHEAMFGVQLRDPAEDRRILEFCLAIPEDQFLRLGTDRWLIRRALADRAPAEILQNPRRGLQTADWLNRLALARPEVMEELNLLERCELARYAIDLTGIRRAVDNISSGVVQAGPQSSRWRNKIDIGLMTARFLLWLDSNA